MGDRGLSPPQRDRDYRLRVPRRRALLTTPSASYQQPRLINVQDSPVEVDSNVELRQRTVAAERNSLLLETQIRANHDTMVKMRHELDRINAEKDSYKLAYENATFT